MFGIYVPESRTLWFVELNEILAAGSYASIDVLDLSQCYLVDIAMCMLGIHRRQTNPGNMLKSSM